MNGKEKTNGSLAMAPRVITIPATSQENQRKLRVAAYARVSSNSEDQKHSFAAQNAYYSKLITDNPDWELADVYADKGITGTSVEKREDFLRMMEDCRKGRIDRILVKSSSRFARNAKESLEAVRELKALGVSVYFEEQNIDTAQASGEILTAMFAALAQRESEAISERMRWSYQMRMQKGEFNTCQAPLGFRLNGRALEIIPEEAKIVRRIFVEYLSGNNSREIARELNKDNTLGLIWNHKTIDYILQNERYAGNALLQKRYASNTLPSKMIYNHGERPQYFVSDINDTIVPKEVFDKAQTLRKERNVLQGQVHSKMSSRMRCACGSRIRAKRIHSLWYWVCCRHDEERTCSLMPIQEMQVEQAFLRLYFKLMDAMEQELAPIPGESMSLGDIDRAIAELGKQFDHLLLEASGAGDAEEYAERFRAISTAMEELKRRKANIQNIRQEQEQVTRRVQAAVSALDGLSAELTEWDDNVAYQMLEKVTVLSREMIRVTLRNGVEIEQTVEQPKRRKFV